MTRTISSAVVLTALAVTTGCATNGDPGPVAAAPDGGTCDAATVQSFVGKPANLANGTAIRDASGARSFRWGAPDSAWTMDYRTDRVNVRYDADMVITEITCG